MDFIYVSLLVNIPCDSILSPSTGVVVNDMAASNIDAKLVAIYIFLNLCLHFSPIFLLPNQPRSHRPAPLLWSAPRKVRSRFSILGTLSSSTTDVFAALSLTSFSVSSVSSWNSANSVAACLIVSSSNVPVLRSQNRFRRVSRRLKRRVLHCSKISDSRTSSPLSTPVFSHPSKIRNWHQGHLFDAILFQVHLCGISSRSILWTRGQTSQMGKVQERVDSWSISWWSRSRLPTPSS